MCLFTVLYRTRITMYFQHIRRHSLLSTRNVTCYHAVPGYEVINCQLLNIALTSHTVGYAATTALSATITSTQPIFTLCVKTETSTNVP